MFDEKTCNKRADVVVTHKSSMLSAIVTKLPSHSYYFYELPIKVGEYDALINKIIRKAML